MAKVRQENSDYWKKRFTALEDDQYRKGAAYYQDLQKQFRTATNNIQIDIERWYGRLADNNNISLAGAKELLKAGELDEFKWSVGQYIKAGQENALDQRWMAQLENASARHHISYLEAMKLQVQQHAEVLFTEYDGGLAGFLNQAYSNRYYHTAFEISKGTGVGTNLAELDTRKIDAILRRPWAQDGASFSDRIWTNKQKLVSNLHTELTQNIIRGSSPQQAISRLAKEMGVSKAQAARLVMTESAAISSIAQQECLKALGVEKFEILATLDSRTSAICREMDGRVFDMVDFEVGTTAPPFHPWCRSVVTPHFEDDFGAVEERAARDTETGETVLVDGKLTYPEWKEQFVDTTVNESERSSQKNKYNSVNWDHVNSKEFHDKFRNITEDSEVNEVIYNKSKDMLKHRNNTDYEDMYLIDVISKKVVAAQTHSTEILSVMYNEELKKAILHNPVNVLISIHNHPRNTPPSGGDFISNARNGYAQGIVACHNGELYMYKAGSIPFTSGLFDRKVVEYQQRPYYLSEEDAYLKVLEEFERDYGIEWRKL